MPNLDMDLFEVFTRVVETHAGRRLTATELGYLKTGFDRGRREARDCLVPAGRAFLVEVELIRLEQQARRLRSAGFYA